VKPSDPAAGARPPHWAEPLPALGVPNLHRLTPTLLRSAQPRTASLPALQSLGVRTIVSFRSYNPDKLRLRRARDDFRLVRVPIDTWHIRDRHVVAALDAILEAEALGPVLIHCMHGADRTGVVAALYRMVVQGWDKPAAMREMFDGGFGYHTVWRNIPAFLEQVEPDAIRAAMRGTTGG